MNIVNNIFIYIWPIHYTDCNIWLIYIPVFINNTFIAISFSFVLVEAFNNYIIRWSFNNKNNKIMLKNFKSFRKV